MKKKDIFNGKKVNTQIVITGLLCITGIEMYALYLGYNGLILTAVIGTIAAAVGVAVPTPKWIKDRI